MNRFKVLTFNKLAEEGLRRLPEERYEVGPDVSDPDAIMLRSQNLHDLVLPGSLSAVARAGAGVNNIPVEALSRRGIPVFNAPGANANAVKELVLGALLMVARNLPNAREYVRGLECDDAQIGAAVEAGKKQFTGFELPSRTLGVIGLGAIGVEVANAALALGMQVVGYDPKVTVRRAWQLSSGVQQANQLDEIFQRADVVSPHVPLNGDTRALVNRARLELLPPGAIVLNFSRQGVVDDTAVLDGRTVSVPMSPTFRPRNSWGNHGSSACLTWVHPRRKRRPTVPSWWRRTSNYISSMVKFERPSIFRTHSCAGDGHTGWPSPTRMCRPWWGRYPLPWRKQASILPIS